MGDMLLEQAMNQGAEVELEEVVSVSAAGEEKTVYARPVRNILAARS